MGRFIPLVMALALSSSAHAQDDAAGAGTGALAGVVRDATGGVLPGALITVRSRTGDPAFTVISDTDGSYFVNLSAAETYGVEIALPNFATRRYAAVRVVAGQTRVLDATLALVLTADVLVTGKRTFRNVAELESAEGGLIGVANSGIDDTTGGVTARYSLSTDWQQTRGAGVTYFLDDPVNGDQFEQADRRWVGGGRLTHRRLTTIAHKPSEISFGGDVRRDAIGEVGLHRTVARRRLATVRQDAVDQVSVGAFVQHEMQWAPWARTNVGLRGDRYSFDVVSGNPLNSGSVSAGLVSPKGALVLGPWRNSEVYLSAGTGFHSNDARGTTITVDPLSGEAADRVTPLARARGAEVGVRSTPYAACRPRSPHGYFRSTRNCCLSATPAARPPAGRAVATELK